MAEAAQSMELMDSSRWSRNLDEVVVTGQGAAIRKRRLSTNVATVGSGDMVRLNSSNLAEMLQTALPNMKINVASGQPGATSLMMARGASSAYGNATPVVYVDGVRVDNLNTSTSLTNDLNGGNHHADNFRGQTATTSAIADIPMENIERIEYVAGGAATTLYGSDAANGVIQIITKKGTAAGFYCTASAELGGESANTSFYSFRRTGDLIHQGGFFQRYRLSMGGGNDRGGWSLGAAVTGNDGTIVENANAQTKYDARLGMHYKISKALEYQSSFGFTVQHLRYARNGNEGMYGGLWTTECGDLTSLKYQDGSGQSVAFTPDVDMLSELAFSQLKEICRQGEGLSDNRDNITRFQTSQAFVFTPIKPLTFKATIGVDYRHNNNRYAITNAWLEATQMKAQLPKSSLRNAERDYFGLTFDINGQHRWRRGTLSAVTTAGFQFFSTDDHQTAILGKDLREGSHIISGAAEKTADEYKANMHQSGLYVQENVGLRDRYYLDFGLRADYNSAFGDNVGWQWYPKVGLSYMMSEEPWMQQQNVVNSLRFFANYGVAGNYPPPYSYQRTVQFQSFQGELAATFGQYGNADLRPEKKHAFEAGFNVSLLSRVNIGLTYYYARTKQALFNVPLPPSVGQGSYLANVGEIENNGVELSLGVEVFHNKDWDVLLNGTLNTNRNRVLSTGGAAAFEIGGFGTSSIQSIVEEGKSVGVLRATRTDLVDGKAVTQTFADLGQTLPSVYGAIGLNITYKAFNLYMNADYQCGSYVHSYNKQFLFRKGLVDERVPDALLCALGMQADGSNRAQIQKAQAFNLTNYFVYKADYLKVRNIGATYEFHEPLRWVKSLTIGFTVNNPFAITSCPVDPEATVSSTLTQGAVATGGFNYCTYSAPRQYIATVKASF